MFLRSENRTLLDCLIIIKQEMRKEIEMNAARMWENIEGLRGGQGGGSNCLLSLALTLIKISISTDFLVD